MSDLIDMLSPLHFAFMFVLFTQEMLFLINEMNYQEIKFLCRAALSRPYHISSWPSLCPWVDSWRISCGKIFFPRPPSVRSSTVAVSFHHFFPRNLKLKFAPKLKLKSIYSLKRPAGQNSSFFEESLL